MTTKIDVVGIGLDGAAGLTERVWQIMEGATVLVGSDRHLSYFPNHPAQRLVLKDLTGTIEEIRQRLEGDERIVVLASGDPLFFGFGRLLLAELPPEKLNFHPHFCSVQLAFNQIKVPWQDARIISAHGRSLEELTQALQQGVEKIAVLTDYTNTPSVIAHLYQALDLPNSYDFWVCENLGGEEERVACLPIEAIQAQTFAPLNIVVLLSQAEPANEPLDINALPILGLPDSAFLSFRDRPGLMTKREVRLVVLGELALQPGQTIWDIGAGTGSVSIEIARLSPTSQVYAIEKTAMGKALIEQNSQRLQVSNVVSVHGSAPDILAQLPAPSRIFIGGSGGKISEILDTCDVFLVQDGVLVLAFATLEHFNASVEWLRTHGWNYHFLQLQLSRSVPVGSLTRFSPLNPVTVITATR
ncbi:MAG: cobalamin biosynthesis bifunctional protein CbiET [Cyanobacteria bacterium QS_3_48_167]|nr:MAG: cobalamin biosynthesis bifunctional protein CbiET [Cyanobacteria bacterium QS_3_48_167]